MHYIHTYATLVVTLIFHFISPHITSRWWIYVPLFILTSTCFEVIWEPIIQVILFMRLVSTLVHVYKSGQGRWRSGAAQLCFFVFFGVWMNFVKVRNCGAVCRERMAECPRVLVKIPRSSIHCVVLHQMGSATQIVWFMVYYTYRCSPEMTLNAGKRYHTWMVGMLVDAGNVA